MDEEKKKYLKELRSQLNPDILSKMANYLGADQGGGGAAATAVGSVSETGASSTDIMSRRRELKFQEKMLWISIISYQNRKN